MKGFLYIVSLLLSAPNLIAGTASLLLKHTFATRNPLQIVTDFLFQVVWGLPLAAGLFLVLLVLGIVAPDLDLCGTVRFCFEHYRAGLRAPCVWAAARL
jgi:hypothetical protein